MLTRRGDFGIMPLVKLALSILLAVASLALNAQTIQGKVVRVSDEDTILDEMSITRIGLWKTQVQFSFDFS